MTNLSSSPGNFVWPPIDTEPMIRVRAMHVLVIEDEPKVAAIVKSGLQEEGLAVSVCHTGDEGLSLAQTNPYDALVLDIMLPGADGLSILRRLRAEGNSVPVVLLTARGDVNDRIEGLNLGADDYLPKPFSVEELIARLRSVWRRRKGEGLHVLSHADLTLEPSTREVRRASKLIELTAREYGLLEFLLRNPGRVRTRTEIYEQVWNYHFDPGTNIVDVVIQRLRRKIDDGHSDKLIQTVRGVGYTLKSES